MAPCFPQSKSQTLPLAYEGGQDLLASSRLPFPGAPTATVQHLLTSAPAHQPLLRSPPLGCSSQRVPCLTPSLAPCLFRRHLLSEGSPLSLGQHPPSPIPCTPCAHACSLLHFLWAMSVSPDETQGSLGRGLYLFSSLTAPKHIEWAWRLAGAP